jgi:hypothetical protein
MFSPLVVALTLLLAGCSLLSRETKSYADDSPMTRSEMCARACNQQHDRCYDASDTRFESYGEPRQVIGMGAACDHTLKDCLSGCRKQ